jgi:hypothetical protein
MARGPYARTPASPGVVVAPSLGAAAACSPLHGLELGLTCLWRVARALGPGVRAARSQHVSAALRARGSLARLVVPSRALVYL